jgi:integrating conjugative element protein (TIGR03759 family)
MKGAATALVLLVVALLDIDEVAQAAQTDTASSAAPAREQHSTIRNSEERQATEWGLTAEDWSRYRELMRGPLGTYSPDLDPLTALGIEARTAAERRRFAELQVRAEARRVEKILSYQRAYDAAWQVLFPRMQRVNASPVVALRGATSAEPGRLAVFVRADCAACDARVRQLQASGSSFDVYLVGSRGDDARIRQWAATAGIDPAKVRARTITLDHDSGRWMTLGLGGDLPALVRQVDGEWQRL